MATRVDLNLPPRLLEAARATQAANRRQLQNRERQVRDAREIKRRLRKIEEEERRATKQRDLWKGAVPEFDLSTGDWLSRRGSLGVAYGYQTLENEQTVTPTYRLWSSNGRDSKTIPITAYAINSEPNDLPTDTETSRVTKRFFGVPLPERSDLDFGVSGTPYTPQTKRFASTLVYTIGGITKAVLPVRRGLFIVVVGHRIRTAKTVETWSYGRRERVDTIGSGLGFFTVYATDAEAVNLNVSPQLFNYNVSWTQFYSWGRTSVEEEVTTEPGPTASFLVSPASVRQLQTPAQVHSWMSTASNLDNAWQGLDAEVAAVVGTPQTIEAATTAYPQSWSPRWLRFSQKQDDPGILVASKITALDPVTHRPLEAAAGVPLPRITVPAQLPAAADLQPSSETLLLAWDWGKPALCRQLLLQLGFTPADLVP